MADWACRSVFVASARMQTDSSTKQPGFASLAIMAFPPAAGDEGRVRSLEVRGVRVVVRGAGYAAGVGAVVASVVAIFSIAAHNAFVASEFGVAVDDRDTVSGLRFVGLADHESEG